MDEKKAEIRLTLGEAQGSYSNYERRSLPPGVILFDWANGARSVLTGIGFTGVDQANNSIDYAGGFLVSGAISFGLVMRFVLVSDTDFYQVTTCWAVDGTGNDAQTLGQEVITKVDAQVFG